MIDHVLKNKINDSITKMNLSESDHKRLLQKMYNAVIVKVEHKISKKKTSGLNDSSNKPNNFSMTVLSDEILDKLIEEELEIAYLKFLI